MKNNSYFRFILILFITFLNLSTYAQTDTLGTPETVQDSLKNNKTAKKDKTKIRVRKPHSPKTAVLLGIVPGGGQIYNRTYWKLPIVYGGLGGLGYWMIDSGSKYRCYRRAYREAVDSDSTTNYRCRFDVDSLSSADLKVRRDQFQRNFEFAVVGFSVFYILTLVDAFVEAHLMYFDIDDDLSMAIRPRMQYNIGSRQLMPSLGVSFRPKFTHRNQVPLPVQF